MELSPGGLIEQLSEVRRLNVVGPVSRSWSEKGGQYECSIFFQCGLLLEQMEIRIHHRMALLCIVEEQKRLKVEANNQPNHPKIEYDGQCDHNQPIDGGDSKLRIGGLWWKPLHCGFTNVSQCFQRPIEIVNRRPWDDEQQESDEAGGKPERPSAGRRSLVPQFLCGQASDTFLHGCEFCLSLIYLGVDFSCSSPLLVNVPSTFPRGAVDQFLRFVQRLKRLVVGLLKTDYSFARGLHLIPSRVQYLRGVSAEFILQSANLFFKAAGSHTNIFPGCVACKFTTNYGRHQILRSCVGLILKATCLKHVCCDDSGKDVRISLLGSLPIHEFSGSLPGNSLQLLDRCYWGLVQAANYIFCCNPSSPRKWSEPIIRRHLHSLAVQPLCQFLMSINHFIRCVWLNSVTAERIADLFERLVVHKSPESHNPCRNVCLPLRFAQEEVFS